MSDIVYQDKHVGLRLKSVKTPSIAAAASAAGYKVSRRDRQVIGRIVQAFADRSRKDIDAWRNAIKLAENPELPRRIKLHDLYNDLDADGHLIAQIAIRKLAVLSTKFRIVNKTTGEEDQEKTRLFQTPWFYKFMELAWDSVMYGTTLIEFGEIEENEFKDVELVPRRHVVPEHGYILLNLGDEKGIDYRAPEFQPWIIQVGDKKELGLMGKIAHYLIWKKNSLQAWAEFNEKFGIPFRQATTNSRNTEDIDRIELMLEQMGSAGYGVFPAGTTVEVKDMSGGSSTGTNTFDTQIERQNSELSKAINGVTMLSDNGSSKSQGEVHLKVSQKIVEADRTKLSFLINWDLTWLLNKHGYGLEGFEFQWDDTESLGKAAHWKIVNEALQHFDIPADWISDNFGFPIDEVKKAKAAAGKPEAPGNQASFNQGLPQERTAGPVASLPLHDAACCSGGPTAEAPAEEVTEWEGMFGKLLKKVYDKKLKEGIPLEPYQQYAKILKGGFEEGFKDRMVSLDYDSPDNQRIAMMEANIFRFSAARSWKEVLDLNKLAGQAADFKSFEEKASAYKKGESLPRLKTEYERAVAGSQNAANWLRQSDPEEAELFDLMYQTIGDTHVRESHRVLEGLTAPVEDPIWNTIYAPNAWNCRCEVVQVPKGSRKHYNSADRETYEAIPQKGFTYNTGKTNMIFEQAHAYFEEFPDEDKLTAETYGLPSYNGFDFTSYPKIKLKDRNEEQFGKWWDKEVKRLGKHDTDLYYQDYKGLNFRIERKELERKLKKSKYSDRNRFGLAEKVEEILQKPDEVWVNTNDMGKAKYRGVYYKLYNEGLYAVVTETEADQLKVITWYEVEHLDDDKRLARTRNGILIKGKA